MSTTIDQRVVEMRFDNKHFEENVSTTMSTLDKLKQKLNLTGASKGLENINTAAKNVNVTGIADGVEYVTAKFSALQVMGVTALANITNSAINAGKRIVKSLTIDPIKTGFDEYETKMGSIQTILANTEHQGTKLADVTSALDDLNRYADKTIYNFQQMTRNIGTFTAAGVDLDTSVRSIKGIANLAAVSGSTSQQASTAMYQLSQALASGTVKLQDWNSVVNAGMGGKVFQNALIRTAAAIDGAADDVDGWKKKNIDAFGSFRDSLTQGAWLTTEVLTATLEQFTMAAEEGSEEWEAFRQSLKASGYTDKQAEEILKMANTATDAATKVKTFTQLMDTLKESAQSGWAQTWELMLGDFEEARDFFTELSDIFGEIIGASADRRNSLLNETMSSNWDKLIGKINEAGIETSKFEDSIRKVVGNDEKLDGLVKRYGSLEKVVTSGEIATSDLKKALDALGETAVDATLGVDKLGRTLWWGHAGEDVAQMQAILKELGYELGQTGVDGIIGQYTSKAVREFQAAAGIYADGIVGPETLAALKEAAEGIEDVTVNVDDSVDSWKELVDVIDQTSGRELLLQSILNIIKAIQRPLQAVSEAFRRTFSVSSDQLYNTLVKLEKFTGSFTMKGVLDVKDWKELSKQVSKFGIKFEKFEDKLVETLDEHGIDVDGIIEKYGDLGTAFENGAISFEHIKEALLSFDGITESLINGGETADKVRRTFEGLFAILDIIATLLAGPLKFAFKIVVEVLERLGLSLLDVTSDIGDSIVKFRDNIDKAIDAITGFIVDGVSEWIKQFKETEFFKTCAEWVETASKTITGAIDDITKRFEDFSASTMVERLNKIADALSDVGNRLSNNEVFMSIIDGICNAFNTLVDFFANFKLPKFNLDSLRNFLRMFASIEGSGVKSVLGIFTELGKFIKGEVTYNLETFRNNLLQKFADFWVKSGEKIRKAFETCKDVANSIKKFLFGAEEIDLPTILGVTEKFLAIYALISAIKLLNTVAAPFDNITDAINNFASSLKWQSVAGAFKAMALAIGVFAAAIIVIAQIDDMERAWSAAGMLVGLIIVMGTVITVMANFISKMDKGIDAAGAAAALLMVVGAIAIMVYTIKQIDKLKLNNPIETFMILFTTILALTAGVRMVSKAAGSSFKSVAAILTLMAALNMVLDVITAYDEYDWSGKTKAIWHMVDMLAVLSIAINIASRGVKENASAKGLALLLIAIVISLKVLIGVIEDFAAMDTDTLKKGGAAVAILLGIMTVMLATISAVNKGTVLQKGERAVNNFVGLATALLAVVAAIWVLGKMDINTLYQGGFAVGQILLLFTGMMYAIGKACSGLKMSSIIVILAGMGLLMAEMAIIINRMQGIPWQNAIGYAGSLALLMVAMAGVLLSLNKHKPNAGNIAGWIVAMVGLGAVMLGLTYILQQIKDIDPANAVGNALALGVILGAIATVVGVLNKASVDGKNITKWIIALAALGLVVAELAFVLYNMDQMDAASAIKNASALSILLGAMSIVTAVISKVNFGWGDFKGILALSALIVPLAVLTGILRNMNGVENAIDNAMALSILIGALSLCTIPLAVVSKIAPTITPGVIALAALAVVLGLLVAGLSKITGIETARENAITLANLAIVLSLCTLPLAIASVIAPVAIVGAGLLVALAVVLGLLVRGLSAIKDTETARANADIIIELLNTLTSMVMQIGSLSFNALTAVAAIAGLIILIKTLGKLTKELGKLSENNSHLEGFIDSGLELFKKLANGLGEIISEFGIGLTSGLPEIASNISEFSNNLKPFVTTMRLVTDDVVTRADNLASAIASLLKADFIGKFTPGTLASLGTELSDFADNSGGFINNITKIRPEVATGMESFCNAVNLLINAAKDNAWTDFWHGEGTLANFGTTIKDFAGCIVDAADALSDITDADVENIKKSASAGEALADLNASIPSQNGWVQDIVGSKELDTFGESIVAFGDCLVAYSQAISGKSIDVEAIEASASAGTALSDLNAAIPKQGGWAQTVMGSQDLANFGLSIVAFAECLVEYSNVVSKTDLNTDAITKSASAAEALADLNGKLPSQNGLYQAVMGEQDLGAFGVQLVSFANGIVAYANAAAQIDESKIDAIKYSSKAIDELILVMDKVPETGGWGDAIFGSSDGESFGTALSSMARGITSYCNTAATIGDDDINAIRTSKAAIVEMANVLSAVPFDLSSGFTELTVAIGDAINCAENLSGLNKYTYEGVSKFKSALVSLSGANINGVVSAFSGKSGEMVDAVKSLINSMTKGLSSGGENVANAMSSVVNKTVKAAEDKAKLFKTVGTEFVSNLAKGIKNKESDVSSQSKSLGAKAVSGARTKYSGMYTAGKYLGDGLVDGINSKQTAAYNAGYALGQAAVQGEKDGQASNSPSKATIKAGKWLGEGLVIGMKRIGSSVYKAGTLMGKDAVGSISTSISKISSLVESGIDAQPTIRPVLDLSNIENGAGAIGSMFGMNPSIGVMTNVGAISTMMNRRSQNGANSEVVSAIDKLRKDLSNIGNTTYSINGITYDDSSNIAAAMEEIVRTARTARRV